MGAKAVTIQDRILDLVKEGGMTTIDMAERIYDDADGGPDYALDGIRVSIFRLRKQGHMISNKPNRYWTGKPGRGNKARYYYHGYTEHA